MNIQILIVTLSLIYLNSVYPSHGFIENLMTVDEIKQTFRTRDANASVPKYDLVQFWYSKEGNPGNDELSFTAFGTNQTVPLKPFKSDLIGSETPMWIARWDDKDKLVYLDDLPKFTIGYEVELYETIHGTVLGSRTDEDGIAYYSGRIGNLVVSPVAKRVSRAIHNKKKRNILRYPTNHYSAPGTEDPSGRLVLSDYHIVYESADSEVEDQLKKIQVKKSKRDVPIDNSTIHPEIVIFADYDFNVDTSDQLFHEFIIYLIAYWNSVNMKFNSLENPHVSLRITGIIIAKTYKAAPFFEEYSSKYSENHIFAMQSLLAMSHWIVDYQHKVPINSYDIMITMTNRHICEKDLSTNDCAKGEILGIAKNGGRCNEGSDGASGMSAIVHDELNFLSIRTAAHEIGHILGAQHDGDRQRGYSFCNLTDSSPTYIMAPVHLPKIPMEFIWSNCSRKTFTRFLKESMRDCFRQDSPINNGRHVGDMLPGELAILELQCTVLGYSHACQSTPNTCKNLECWTDGFLGLFTWWKCRQAGPALDGSPCGPDHYCNYGQCIPKPQRIFFESEYKEEKN